MKVSVYKTPKVTAGSYGLFELLDSTLHPLKEESVVAVAAKIVSLCEGRVVPQAGIDKDKLIREEAQWFVPRGGKYHISHTITHNLLVPTAGIDESNANGQYILWPKDPQASANAVWEHLRKTYNLHSLGVIITDSTSRPFQWGTTGIAIASCGFEPIKDYVGSEDVFGRKLKIQKSNIANGLAASAVTLMGEGDEQTPVALIEDVPFVQFTANVPSRQEVEAQKIAPQDDLYWPLLQGARWQKGGMDE